MGKRASVFIGSSSEGRALAEKIDEWLTHKAGDEFMATVWTDGAFALNEGYLESLTKAARTYDFAILIATADDSVEIRHQQALQARDNVIFELGLFLGRLGRTRTFLVCTDHPSLRLPSDLSGVTVLRFSQQEINDSDPVALKRVCHKLLDSLRSSTEEDGGYFVLFPSLRNEPFYLDLLAGIACPASGTRDVTFLVPRDPYNGPQFLEQLDELADKQRGFKGGLIAPTLAGVEIDEIRKRLDRFRIPIVLVDVNPYDGVTLPEKRFFVGVDNYAGGKLAGEYLLSVFGSEDKPHVLILGNQDQHKRHEGCIEALGTSCEVTLVLCDFSASASRTAMVHALRHHTSASGGFRGVFAASDAIALGAVEALNDIAPSTRARETVVVGFDGAATAKTLIDMKVGQLRNTVVQDAYALGERSMSMLKEVADGRAATRAKRERVLPVRLYIEYDRPAVRSA
jgi:ABC-type sugar transport system substrate-binding protein